MALAAGAAAIWLDPARATLGYGQVDILLAAAVLYDLTLPDGFPAEGRGDRTGRGHQAHPGDLRGIPADDPALPGRCHRGRRFAATIAAGFAVIPASSAWYWAGEFANPGHVSPVQDPENQSLLGVLHGRCTP